jgi:hypothetical protein
MHARITDFAHHNKTVVIQWLTNFMNWKQQPPSEFLQDALQDPCFYEYFVQGANGFITENVFRDLHIVNALPVVFHSIKFSPIIEKYVNDIIDILKPGSIITVEEHPISVNVKVCLSENTPIDIKKALVHLSLVKELDKDGDAQIILPLTEYSCSWDNTETPIYGKYPFFLASKVTLK